MMAWHIGFGAAVAIIVVAAVSVPDVFGSTADSPAVVILAANSVPQFSISVMLATIVFSLYRSTTESEWKNKVVAVVAVQSACVGLMTVAFAYAHPWPSATTTEKTVLICYTITAFLFLALLGRYSPNVVHPLKSA